MTNSSEITTNTCRNFDLHDHPKTRIVHLSEVVAAQAGENRRPTAEPHILGSSFVRSVRGHIA